MSNKNAQLLAADPESLIFLTANAGSGKTSTLVNRVARLLIHGARPEKILCVTYTKAAAAEMQSRLFERLGTWAVADDEALQKALNDIDEPEADLSLARTLFARALETPGGLKIQTLHAFCEKLLRRFPLEAGLSPSFEILDDLTGADLKRRARDKVLCLPESALPDICAARDRLIVSLKEQRFESLLSDFVGAHDKLKDRAMMMSERGEEAVYQALGLLKKMSREDAFGAILDVVSESALSQLIEFAQNSKGHLQKFSENFCASLERLRSQDYTDESVIFSPFYASDGSKRATTQNKKTLSKLPVALKTYEALEAAYLNLTNTLNAIETARNSWDAARLFLAFSLFYQEEKKALRGLDFQDLITKTKALLQTRDASDWVLYKLDEGLDHVLVDEAQDTSEDQWDIVNALSQSFFDRADEGAKVQTLFAVGDEKQSIYGFQGARPELFLSQGQAIAKKAEAAKLTFRSPMLHQSYRTLPAILGFVDKAFNRPDVRMAMRFSEDFSHDILRHTPQRQAGLGLVELWPKVQSVPKVELSLDDDFDAPVDADPVLATAQKRLANTIADQVQTALSEGYGIYERVNGVERLRPLRPQDVLILVRSRNALFEHIIRALKQKGVPVSGADRLKLEDHIAFEDLRALLRVCLQPSDDLSLASILRSPLCDHDESDLFKLARGRDGSLWQALCRDESAKSQEAVSLIGWAIDFTKTNSVFALLSRLFQRKDSKGISVKQRFLTRLGDECCDVLDETLMLALKAENAGFRGVVAALEIFEYHASEIKREQDGEGHAVRIMTVHGSKGLEAPWVIVPISPQHRSNNNQSTLLYEDEAFWVAPSSKAKRCEAIDALLSAKSDAEERESLRLFYVALTRARDRLTVCGYSSLKNEANSNYPRWYAMAEEAIQAAHGATPEPMKVNESFSETYEETVPIWVAGQRAENQSLTASDLKKPVDLPDFIKEATVDIDENQRRWAAISQMGDEDRASQDKTASPLSETKGLGRYRRGHLIHKLFELLPDIAVSSREAVARTYLLKQPDLSEPQRLEILGAVMAVLNDEQFMAVFGEGSRPEVAVSGPLQTASGTVMLTGRIDRLIITDNRVLILDYKSNRPAPKDAESAYVDYQRQLAGYVALMRQIYPIKTVEAAFLWTDGPKLTPLMADTIERILSEL